MKEDRKIKNVVLIMLDTLQFNYLGCYGNKVVKTPNIDRLARQGFLFENAYRPAHGARAPRPHDRPLHPALRRLAASRS